MSRARQIADFGDGIATADIDDGAVTAAKIGSLPEGSVLQVVQGSASTQVTNSTNVMADTGLSATITPSSASNKILILIHQNGLDKSNANSSNSLEIDILRGSTVILERASYALGFQGLAQRFVNSASFVYLDSPSTTSATTYKTQFANNVNAASVSVQLDNISPSTIVLMEIAG